MVMANRLVVFLIFLAGTPLPAASQGLDLGDVFNLGNQILNGTQVPDPAPPQVQTNGPAASQQVADIYETQALLTQLGFNPGQVDGVMGGRTAHAIRQFQAGQGLPQTGQTSPDLVARLRRFAGTTVGATSGGGAPLSGGQATSPSFDCGRATTTVELAICRSPELAQLDRALSDAYLARKAAASTIRGPGLAAEQKAWLILRDRCGDSSTCLSKAMTGRIAQLGGSAVATGGAGVPAQDGRTVGKMPPGDAAPPQTDTLIVEGRRAIFNDGSDKTPGLWRLFELVGMIPGDPRYSPDNLPLWTGDLLGAQELRAIATQAANGVASTMVETFLSSPQLRPGISPSEFVSMQLLANDFERQRFAALLRDRVAAVLPGMRPQTPVPVRFFCRLELTRNQQTQSPLYDFDTQTFQIAGFAENCATADERMVGRKPRPALGTINHGRFLPTIETGDYPASIALAPDQAEEFVNVMSKHPIVIGFDGELDARSGRSKGSDSAPGSEPVSLYTIRRTGPYKLYYQSQPDRAIYVIAPDQLRPKPLTDSEKQARRLADMDRIWTFYQPDEQQVLLDLATSRGSYSADLFGGDGLLTFTLSPAIGNWDRVSAPVPEDGLRDGFDTATSRRIAQALGRPQSAVFAARMGLMGGGGSPVSQVYVALPDVLENYKRPPPPTKEKLDLWINFRMTRVWQLPGQRTEPEILIFAVPVSGSYYRAETAIGASQAPVFEFRFDATGPIDYARSNLARPRDILAAVAQATGSDRAGLIASLYPATSQDAFARRDEIDMLASTAEPVDLGGFWMTGNGQFADYDFEAQVFGFDYLNLGFSDNLSRNEGGIRREKLFRLTNVDDSLGLRFPMAEDEARRLLQATAGSDATFRVLIVAVAPDSAGQGPGLPMPARIAEIVVLRPGSDPQVEVGANILARIAIASGNEPAGSDAAPPTTTAAGAYDILDIRIRQDFDTVLPAITASFVPETVIYGRREVWAGQTNLPRPVTLTTPLAEATILVREGGDDSLTIFHEPLLPGNPVTGIARTLRFSEGKRPAPDAVKALLVDKYGVMDAQQDFAFDWFHAAPLPGAEPSGEMSVGDIIRLETEAQAAQTFAFRCKQLLSSVALQFDQEAQSLVRIGSPAFTDRSYPVVDQDNAQVPLPGTNPLWPMGHVETSNPECGEDFVVAVIEPDSTGLVSMLRILVTNRGYLAEIEAQARQALIDMNASEAGAAPKIKL